MRVIIGGIAALILTTTSAITQPQLDRHATTTSDSSDQTPPSAARRRYSPTPPLTDSAFTRMQVKKVTSDGPGQVKFFIRKYAPSRSHSEGNISEIIVNVPIDNKGYELSEIAIKRLAVPAAKKALLEAAEALDRNPIGSPY